MRAQASAARVGPAAKCNPGSCLAAHTPHHPPILPPPGASCRQELHTVLRTPQVGSGRGGGPPWLHGSKERCVATRQPFKATRHTATSHNAMHDNIMQCSTAHTTLHNAVQCTHNTPQCNTTNRMAMVHVHASLLSTLVCAAPELLIACMPLCCLPHKFPADTHHLAAAAAADMPCCQVEFGVQPMPHRGSL